MKEWHGEFGGFCSRSIVRYLGGDWRVRLGGIYGVHVESWGCVSTCRH